MEKMGSEAFSFDPVPWVFGGNHVCDATLCAEAPNDGPRNSKKTIKYTSDSIHTASELLDKLVLQSLHLVEEKLQREMALEVALSEGTFHLAKSRYIMGQNSVSSLRLPTEDSAEFLASSVCEEEERDGVTHLQMCYNDGEDTVNPIKWFGVLVPQNLYKAQSIFKSTLDYVVECANIHIRLSDALNNIQLLKSFKEKNLQ